MNKILKTFLITLFISSHFYSKAQVSTITDTAFLRKPIKQTDLIDIVHKILYKPQNIKERGSEVKKGKTYISVLPAAGYTLQTGFAALISGNISFYTSNHEKQKISNILTSFTYTQYKQIIAPLYVNLWTKNNKHFFVLDWRYMHYPSILFGLNGQTSLSDKYSVQYSYLKIHQSAFKCIGNNMYAGIGFYYDHLWNIEEFDLPPNSTTLFQQYGFSERAVASGPVLRLLYDSRLNQVNPENGFYANMVYRPNFTFLGSHSTWQSLLLDFRKYFKFPTSKNVLAFWSYNWLTLQGKPPYLLLPSTGWDDAFNTGRGYIQGRFKGRNMIYLESEYRFGITRNGLFGGVVFTNAQLFSKASSFALNAINPAIGTGIRVKLNKFSGSNLCIDYGVGTHGSRGFFVNLNEVF